MSGYEPTGHDDRARVIGGTDGPDQGDPAAWTLYTPDGRLMDTVYSREQALAADEYGGCTVVPLYRAPGAVAAAPGTVDDLARLLAASWAVAEPSHGVTLHPVSYVASWVDVARALADAGWRPGAVAAAPPGAEDDDATEAVLDWVGAVLLTDAPLSVRASAQRVAVLIEVHGWRLVPPVPPAGHEDEAAVERVAEFIAGTVAWRYGDDDDRAEWRGRARGVLAAARGPRTPGDGAS